MNSRIVAIILSLLLFFSSLYFIGFPEIGDMANATTEPSSDSDPQTTVTTSKRPVETVLCSFRDISYGTDEKQTLDLILPVDDREETGLLLYIHGGGWTGGDKATSPDKFKILSANKKYAVASINYRYAELGKTDIYDIVNDITSALSHIKNLAAGYSVNINEVVLCGHSAGGHLSLFYAYRYKDISPIKPVGVIVTAPAVDLSLDEFYKSNDLGDEKFMCELMSKACGKEFTPETRAEHINLLKELSPTEYVTTDCVPTLIVHGKKDTVAPFKGSESLCEQLSSASVPVELIAMENSGHRLDNDKETKEYASTVMYERIITWLGITSE